MPGLRREATEIEHQSQDPVVANASTNNGTTSTNNRITSTDNGGVFFHILEIAAGEDVARKITSFFEENRGMLSIMSATGTVSSFTIRQPGTTDETLTYEGSLDLVSIGGILMPRESPGGPGNLTITVAGREGVGRSGEVAGPVIAQSLVRVCLSIMK